MRHKSVLILLLFAIYYTLPAAAQWKKEVPITTITKQPDGIRATFQSGAVLKLQVCSESIIHVVYSPTSAIPSRPEYVVTKTSWPATQFNVETAGSKTTLSTAAVKATIDQKSGSITFSSGNDQLFTNASNYMTPAMVNGGKTYRS